jgi:GNAT superfamily N-acetyltransferase
MIRNQSVQISLLSASDIPALVDAFQKADWPKSPLVFKAYEQEQQRGDRLIWIARIGKEIAGYVTLKWQSPYEPFAMAGIPEIMDLNVLPKFQKAGIGSTLLEVAENEAGTRNNRVGIGVGLYGGSDGGYGSAQRLYVKRDYIPDAKGVTYHYKPAHPGQSYCLDDDLVLWFTKSLP